MLWCYLALVETQRLDGRVEEPRGDFKGRIKSGKNRTAGNTPGGGPQ